MVVGLYVLYGNHSATFKRKWYRRLMIVNGVFFLVLLAASVRDLFLLLLVLPVLAWIVFGSLRFTKFCEWCGSTVRTNLPFIDKKHCPRCGSDLA